MVYNNEIVSVIIPIYNSEKYLKETVESVLKQTYDKIEIVLIDDCSKDNSPEILKELSEKYNNIVFFLQTKNMGAAAARNKGMELASGRYIAFLDSDDLWYPKKIEKQIALMKEKKQSFSYTSYEMIDENKSVIIKKTKVLEHTKYKDLLKNTLIATPTVVIDRNSLGTINMPGRRTGQDYAYWLLLLRNGKIAYGIDEVLVTVKRRKSSLSKNKFQNLRDVWEVQVFQEKIPRVVVLFNMFCYILNTLKKRYF